MDYYSGDETESSDNEAEYCEEARDFNQEVDCLFCSFVFNSISQALSHCAECHKIDFKNLKIKFNMDCYSFIKFVNFIRETSVLPEDLNSTTSPLWNNEIYLKPVKENDPWLIFDLDDYCETTIEETNSDFLVAQASISELQFQLVQKEEELSALRNQITLMKNCVRKIVSDDTLNGGVDTVPLTMDNSYFDSYCNPGIHHEMLSDSVRTQSYKDAILNNDTVFCGKTILDLGCGTGILSMFAASTSSQKVYAIDNSDIAYYAIEIIKENKLDSKVDVIKGRIEDDRTEFEKVDVIISEWMGYFLLFEGMLDSLIYARDHYLKPGGVIMPDSCNLFICGAEDPEAFKDKIAFWSDVYGYRMSAIRREVMKEAVIDIVPSDKIVTSEACVSSFNLHTCTVADTNFTSSFELICHADAIITTLVGYFDTTFNLPYRAHFSTGPFSPSTHWKQTLFYIPEPISKKKGEKLSVNLTCERCASDKRSLCIKITIDGRDYVYNIR